MFSFLEYVEKMISDDEPDVLTAAAGNSFTAALQNHSFEDVSNDALSIWIVMMALDGLKVNTRKKYFNRLHTMWRDWKNVSGEDPFEAVRGRLDMEIRCDNEIAAANLERISLLVNRSKDTPDREYIEMFLYLLYTPSATVCDVVDLKFAEAATICPQTDYLIDRQKEMSRRSRYVFGLGQGKKREPQIIVETLSKLKEVAESVGIKTDTEFSRETITAIWIAAALRADVPVAEIRSLISSVPAEYSSFGLVPVLPLTERRKETAIRKVADSIDNRPAQWFVMKMRSGQTPDSIKRKIADTTEGFLAEMMFYYPTRKEIRMTPGGKRIRKDVPYLPGVLFFRISRDKVPVLMSRIGDAAWCYKYSISKGSRYCTISRNEMQKFQHHIGQFTPDIRMELVTRRDPLEIGSEVMISGGGMFEGHIGRIQSFRNADGTRTYTLALSNEEYAKWTIRDIEEVFIEPFKDNMPTTVA